jgi:hypothetical protein
MLVDLQLRLEPRTSLILPLWYCLNSPCSLSELFFLFYLGKLSFRLSCVSVYSLCFQLASKEHDVDLRIDFDN